jgi:hypothetical protein
MKKDLSNPDLPYAALEMSARAAFIKESCLKCAEVTSCTGDPGNRSHDRSHQGCDARLPGFSVDPASCQKRKRFRGDEMEPETGALGSPQRTWAENDRFKCFSRRTQLSQN